MYGNLAIQVGTERNKQFVSSKYVRSLNGSETVSIGKDNRSNSRAYLDACLRQRTISL